MDEPMDDLRRVLADHHVVFALLFGSRTRRDHGPDSDIDLAVMPSDATDLWDLRGALGEGVDMVDLRTAPEYLTGRVALEGEVVMETDPAARVRWQADRRKRHLDERFRRDQFRRDFAAAHG